MLDHGLMMETEMDDADWPREGCCEVTLVLRPALVDALCAQAERDERSLSEVAGEVLQRHLVGDSLDEPETQP